MNDAMLAARRRELVERCAEQRVGLAYELKALRRPGGAVSSLVSPLLPASVAPLVARLLAHRRLVYGTAGAAFALAIIRPQRVQRLTRLAASGLRLARQGLALAARYRM